MTQTASPRRPREGYGSTTRYGARRRHRRLLAGFLTASAVILGVLGVGIARWTHDDARRDYLSGTGWPATGEGAYRLGDGPAAASPNQTPSPIASIAKVMTARLVLRAHPLTAGASGFILTVSAADVADTARRRRQDQSLIPVAAGERLTERQALMALLLPSANNVAIMLARRVAGTVRAFVARMNDAAKRLGMRQTTYTDPSGFDPRTVSTASDQLILAEAVARDPVLTAMMATSSYRLPVAGTVHNTNPMLGSEGFVGMKTGSDDAAGGCLMFRIERRTDGRRVHLIGVVLGQSGRNLIVAAATAARQLAAAVAPE